jgi:hypothetical protein
MSQDKEDLKKDFYQQRVMLGIATQRLSKKDVEWLTWQ